MISIILVNHIYYLNFKNKTKCFFDDYLNFENFEKILKKYSII